MSLSEYREYKDSVVGGLRQIPSHWSTPPLYLRYQADLGKMLDASRITGESLHPYLRNVDVQWGRINFEDLPQMDIAPTEVARYTVQAGDLLVCEGGEVGRAAVVEALEGLTAFQKALHRLRPIHADEVPKYMFYVLRWAADTGAFSTNGQSTIAHLTGEQLRKCRFPCPPGDEQATIAAFLDRETSKIDALIAEQETLITLLAEKRQATISHAVTRGLNPNAPMKDYGVAWLGEVPVHWELKRLRNLATAVQTGRTPSSEAPTSDVKGGLDWYTPGDFGSELVLGNASKRVSDTLATLGEAKIFPTGSILVVSIGATLGKVGLTDRPASANQQINALVLPETCNGRFFAYSLSVKAGVMRFLSNASTIGIMNQEKTKEIVVAVPPVGEQGDIADLLDLEMAKIAALVAEAHHAIALLNERRTALIAAAVTGQIDVRGAVAPEASP